MKAEKERTLYEKEPERLAYMVAWRDRYIEALEERVKGWEETHALLQALLYCALADRAAVLEDGSRETVLTREAVSEAVAAWESAARVCEEGYAVRFTPRLQGSDEEGAGEDGAEGAQA